jgi:hypothetical protein
MELVEFWATGITWLLLAITTFALRNAITVAPQPSSHPNSQSPQLK